MTPKDFLTRLSDIAQNARYHPEPAAVVALLAQLLLDVSVQIVPLAERFSLILQANGFPGPAGEALDAIEAELKALATPAEPAASVTENTATTAEPATQDATPTGTA